MEKKKNKRIKIEECTYTSAARAVTKKKHDIK